MLARTNQFFLFFTLLRFFLLLFMSLTNFCWRNQMLEQPLLFNWLLTPCHAFGQYCHLSQPVWLRDTMPCHGHYSHLSQPVWLLGHLAAPLVATLISHQPLVLEVEDFPGGAKYPKHVPLPIYFHYFPPKGFTW